MKQKRLLFSLLIIISLHSFAGCASLSGDPQGPPPDPVTVKDIVDMSKAGLPPQIIVDNIKKSRTVYRLKASQLAQLKEMGVSDEVINYMQQTYIEAARQDQAYNDMSNFFLADDGFLYGGPYYGGPWW